MTTRNAFQEYEAWCAAGFPEKDLADTLFLAIGYVFNCTDGCPHEDERALSALLARKLREVKAQDSNAGFDVKHLKAGK